MSGLHFSVESSPVSLVGSDILKKGHALINTDTVAIKSNIKICSGGGSVKKKEMSWILELKPSLYFTVDTDSNKLRFLKSSKPAMDAGAHTLLPPAWFVFLFDHCAVVSCAQVEASHIELYSERRLHPRWAS